MLITRCLHAHRSIFVMSINGSVEQGEDALNIAVDTGGVNHGPVRDFRTLDEPS